MPMRQLSVPQAWDGVMANNQLRVRAINGDMAGYVHLVSVAYHEFAKLGEQQEDCIFSWGKVCCYVKRVKTGVSMSFWTEGTEKTT